MIRHNPPLPGQQIHALPVLNHDRTDHHTKQCTTGLWRSQGQNEEESEKKLRKIKKNWSKFEERMRKLERLPTGTVRLATALPLVHSNCSVNLLLLYDVITLSTNTPHYVESSMPGARLRVYTPYLSLVSALAYLSHFFIAASPPPGRWLPPSVMSLLYRRPESGVVNYYSID